MKNKTTNNRDVIIALTVGLWIAFAVTTAITRASANTFTVTNLNDSGDGSLRQAILDANANPGADEIDFQDELSGTITLTSGQLTITDDLTINGPGIFVITVDGNHASRVFSVEQFVTVTISGLTVSNGSVTDNAGGGIFNVGNLTLSNVVLSGNSAVGANTGGAGGAVFNSSLGNLTINNSALNNNSASRGGGIFNSAARVVITNSTLSGNSSGRSASVFGTQGGGILNFSGTLTVVNSTLSGNSAINANGGALSNQNGGKANISFVTMSGNSASSGGGIYNNPFDGPTTTVNIKNSIVANSPSGGDCDNRGRFNATGVNFTTNGTCPGFTQVTSAQLKLGSLANNGGPTPTHALLPGSVAIDAVTDCTDLNGNPITTDQRGVARPQGSACDVGAYEAAPSFDLCIQDDSNGNILQINTTTGDYQFTNCAGLTIGGTGILTKRGSQITLQHNASDRRVMASIDSSTKRATASIQLFSQGRTFSITDRNITNSTCACR